MNNFEQASPEQIPSNEMVSENLSDSFEKVIENADVLFVLAHGDPPEKKLSKDARIRTLAAVEAVEMRPELQVAFVGGCIEQGDSRNTSRQMQKYFSSRAGELEKKPVVLDKSNNTTGNLEEILDYLSKKENHQFRNVVIASSRYHLKRIEAIKEILGGLEVDCQLVPAESLVEERSKRHQRFLEKYRKSLGYHEAEVLEKVQFLLLKEDVDPARLIEKFRKWRRKSKK